MDKERAKSEVHLENLWGVGGQLELQVLILGPGEASQVEQELAQLEEVGMRTEETP